MIINNKKHSSMKNYFNKLGGGKTMDTDRTPSFRF